MKTSKRKAELAVMAREAVEAAELADSWPGTSFATRQVIRDATARELLNRMQEVVGAKALHDSDVAAGISRLTEEQAVVLLATELYLGDRRFGVAERFTLEALNCEAHRWCPQQEFKSLPEGWAEVVEVAARYVCNGMQHSHLEFVKIATAVKRNLRADPRFKQLAAQQNTGGARASEQYVARRRRALPGESLSSAGRVGGVPTHSRLLKTI